MRGTYNAVSDAYMSDEIEQSDEVEANLNQAKELIESHGEVGSGKPWLRKTQSQLLMLLSQCHDYLALSLEAM